MNALNPKWTMALAAVACALSLSCGGEDLLDFQRPVAGGTWALGSTDTWSSSDRVQLFQVSSTAFTKHGVQLRWGSDRTLVLVQFVVPKGNDYWSSPVRTTVGIKLP
jgi:hypothetical protein